MNKKLLIRYLLILILTAVLFLAGFLLLDRIITPEGQIEPFYDEPRNTIDVLCVGGSQVMCSISPNVIYEQTGLTAYDIVTWSQPTWVSYHYIKEALKTQKPQVIALDVFGSFYEHTYMTGTDVDLVSDDYSPLLRPSLNLLQLNLARRKVQVTEKRWYEYLNIAKYHSRISELTKESFTKLLPNGALTGKGYGPFYTTEDFSGYEYPVTDAQTELYPYAASYLEKIIALCEQQGIRLVFIKLPHIADENDLTVLNSIWQLAAEHGIDCLDFQSSNTLGLDFATDFSDHGHLNYLGAQKASTALSTYLNSLSLHPSHSKKTVAAWDAACAAEDDMISEMHIRLATDFSQMIECVDSFPVTSVLFTVLDDGTLNGTDYEKMAQLFSDAGCPVTVAQLQAGGPLVYTRETLLTGDDAVTWCAERSVSIKDGDILWAENSYSYRRIGLNVAFFNEKTPAFYHYISYAKQHGYEPYTQ